MLLELTISNFAIIRESRLEFEPGFNALTGETGAGKSILIDALGAVLGERVGSDVVRTGTRAARVDATFDVTELELREDFRALLEEVGAEPEDGILILSREIGANGRGSARINGRATTASTLGRIGAFLVDIHGQSDHLSLLRPTEQMDILDRFAGLMPLREQVAARVAELNDVRDRINNIERHARERAQRIDLLRFQAQEILAADLRPREEEELLAERRVLANAEQIAEDATLAYGYLHGDDDAFGAEPAPAALPALRQANDLLSGLTSLDPTVEPLANRLAEVLYLLEDIAAEVRDYRETIEADPMRLQMIEDRLDLLKSLKRKYGATIEEVIRTGEAAAAELAELEGDETNIDALREREARLSKEVGRLVADLSHRRQEAGERLSRAVERAIAELNMGRAQVGVLVEQTDDPRGVPFGGDGSGRLVHVDRTGADRVTFMLAPNVGEAMKPLGRVASGGETARLMLALKSILSAADETPTLVFDEVDVGVGGRSGQVVGEKLWQLSTNHQVLVITHLPQIAAFAQTHFKIEKHEEDGRIVSRVNRLHEDERIDELAAMLDGYPVTPASRENARTMLERVEGWIARHQPVVPTSS